jgi:hypothetical protein
MLLLLVSADERAEKHKDGNHADEKSHMHLQNLFAKADTVAGMQRKLPRNFCKVKANKCPVMAPANAVNFGSSGSDSMKPTLLLSDEAETTRLMLKDVAFDQLPVRDTEAHAGCNCDRWGHPCPGCVNPDIVPGAETPVLSSVKQ